MRLYLLEITLAANIPPSCETAAGLFPARAVQTLDAVIRDAESGTAVRRSQNSHATDDHDHAQAICEAAVRHHVVGGGRLVNYRQIQLDKLKNVEGGPIEVNPNFGNPNAYQAPRIFRFGARAEF